MGGAYASSDDEVVPLLPPLPPLPQFVSGLAASGSPPPCTSGRASGSVRCATPPLSARLVRQAVQSADASTVSFETDRVIFEQLTGALSGTIAVAAQLAEPQAFSPLNLEADRWWRTANAQRELLRDVKVELAQVVGERDAAEALARDRSSERAAALKREGNLDTTLKALKAKFKLCRGELKAVKELEDLEQMLAPRMLAANAMLEKIHAAEVKVLQQQLEAASTTSWCDWQLAARVAAVLASMVAIGVISRSVEAHLL